MPTNYADLLLGRVSQQAAQTTDWASMLVGDKGRTITEAVPTMPGQTAYDPAKTAGMSTLALASIPEETEAKIKLYAERLYPDLAPEVARRAFKVENGEILRYVPGGRFGEGTYAPVEPRGWTAGKMAMGVGPSMTAVPAAAVGAVTAPLALTGPPGLAVSMGATGLAGAVGQSLRERVASILTGQQTSAARVAREGAMAGLAQGIGTGFNALAQRYTTKDIARLDPHRAATLEEKARIRGIRLTPAELTDLPSLKAQQKALGNLPQSADEMDDFYSRRSDKISQFVRRFMGAISAEDSGEVAGKRIREAAQSAIQQAKDARDAAASPYYQKAFDAAPPVDVRPLLQQIDDEAAVAKGGIAKALQGARDLLMKAKDLPEDRLAGLHQAKLALDDMIENARESGLGRTARRKLVEIQHGLLSLMDDASSDYAAARAAFRQGSPAVDDLAERTVGLLANLKDTGLQKAAAKLFDPAQSGPRAVGEARAALSAADPEAWQAIKRAWLQQQWERSGKEFVSTGSQVVNQGPKFRALLLGDEGRRRILSSALNPREMQALTDLADVLEAAGRVKPIGSDTAWNQEMMRLARSEATPGIAKIARVLRPQDWGKIVEDWATERALRNRAKDIASIITSPDGMKELRALRQSSPSSMRFRVGVAHLLTLTAREAAASGIDDVLGDRQ